jgi:hypothetical protein
MIKIVVVVIFHCALHLLTTSAATAVIKFVLIKYFMEENVLSINHSVHDALLQAEMFSFYYETPSKFNFALELIAY